MKRIQRKRIKGWRKPENCVCVDRSSVFGNPFRVGIEAKDRPESLKMFREWLFGGNIIDSDARRVKLINSIHRLLGKDICCFCDVNEDCHGDILIKYVQLKYKKLLDDKYLEVEFDMSKFLHYDGSYNEQMIEACEYKNKKIIY